MSPIITLVEGWGTPWQRMAIVENKDRLIDKNPNFLNYQKPEIKNFFKKRPQLENRFDWNRPKSITWDKFERLSELYRDPIDPKDVPELSDPRDEGDGIVSYQVTNDKAGQKTVRKIVDTHWGESASPWCIISTEVTNKPIIYINGKREDEYANNRAFQIAANVIRLGGGGKKEAIKWLQNRYDTSPGSGWGKIKDIINNNEITVKNNYVYDMDDIAWGFWQEYSRLPKRIAFKDGKLLAMMAVSKYSKPVEQWWDRHNNLHPNLDWAR